MQLTNTKQAFGWISIGLHWFVGFGVIALFVIGFMAGRAEDAHERARHLALMALHISLGAGLLVFALARVAWHLAQTRPSEPAQPWALRFISIWTQRLLLAAICIQFISGPLMVWGSAHPIAVFNWVSLPSPFAGRQRELVLVAGAAHFIGRMLILWLVPLHILGALKHLVLDRDGAFERMLWPRKLRSADQTT